MRIYLGMAAMILIAAPLSFLTTILLLPFWSWLEATTGIESVGHSGPAEWCYAAVFMIMIASAVQPILSRIRDARGGKEDS
jgi:TRAP-type C4-dicarboxylate transport system permease small subunit